MQKVSIFTILPQKTAKKGRQYSFSGQAR